MSPRFDESLARKRVLVRMPSWLGDCVAAEPALRALLAATDGGRRLSIAMPEAFRSLFRPLAPRAAFVPVDDRSAWRGHDVAVLFPGSFRSAWAAWRAGIPRRVGWSRDGRGWLLTDRARPALERGGTALGTRRRARFPRYLPRSFQASAQELVGLLGLPVDDPRPRLVVEDAVRKRVAERLSGVGIDPDEPIVLVNVGARARSAKAVPAALLDAGLERLAGETRLGFPVLVCGPGEEAGVEELRALLRARGAPHASLASPAPDLLELVALAQRSALVWTADGGARHVAAAAGASVVCVFGPTDPRHTAHALEHTRGVRASGPRVPCAPCHLERCPLQGSEFHRCMTAIDPEALVDATLALWSCGCERG